ncbi:MAG: bifunctional methionine sulfoxide reductase B/A protein [Bacteroidota bacterium]|jgi:peptide methionine sulfoxide reductase msrA/msrB
MKKIIGILIMILITMSACTQNNTNKSNTMNYTKLTPEEENVIINKGTERPFTGKYYKTFDKGVYVCKRCRKPLYNSSDKFASECGWPSFDDEIKGAVTRKMDADGSRTEIICNNCGAHLGHVFIGEHLTQKNTRHCVNSISLEFIPASNEEHKTDTAILAGGCFWGVEYYMMKSKGVISTEVGYIGGHKNNPTYEDVCSHTTGHAEAARIIFDPSIISYEDITKLFLEIHDPTQTDRQGPDIGDQYRSEIFYLNDDQKGTAEYLIDILNQKGYKIATKLTKATTFWKAEDYHQQYYSHKGSTPYCHKYVKRF